jgi:hypothetical protein
VATHRIVALVAGMVTMIAMAAVEGSGSGRTLGGRDEPSEQLLLSDFNQGSRSEQCIHRSWHGHRSSGGRNWV